MKCSKCGTSFGSDMKFCPNCGQPIENIATVNSSFNNDSSIGASTIMAQGSTMTPNFQSGVVNNSERVNVGLVILSCLFPIIGIILFFVNKKKQPKNAKACGLGALISIIVSVVLTLMIVIPIVNDVIDTAKGSIDYNEEENIIEEENDIIVEDTNTNDDENIGTVSNNWKDYQIEYNGQIISLPTTYQKVSSITGFTYKDSALQSYLDNNYYISINMYYNDKLALYTETTNDTGVTALYTDCNITRISQTKYQASQTGKTFIFPGGLKVGEALTEADLIALVGQPTDKDVYSSDNYEKITYTYNANTTWTTTNLYKIEVVNGIIDQLTLDNR